MPEKLTPEQVRHVARLSRLELSDSEIEAYAHSLSHVLDYVSKLNELDVTDVEPMAHSMDVHNVLREDVAQPGWPVEKMLQNAPEQSPPFFKVPKVIGEGSGA